MALRRDEVAALEREEPEVFERNRARRIHHEQALENRTRAVGATGLRVRDAQRVSESTSTTGPLATDSSSRIPSATRPVSVR